MKCLFLTCVLWLLYGTAVSVVREFFYDTQTMNWSAANYFCRQEHGHLIRMYTDNEFNTSASRTGYLLVWIGLKKAASPLNTWKWVDGQIANYTRWGSGEPTGYPFENCVVMDKNGWRDTYCSGRDFAPACSRTFTLVKEKKTWEEALRHCRINYTGLAFVKTSDQLNYFSQLLSKETQTDSAWTGLRFLDGQWFWVNGVKMESLVSLPPQCPIFRCGAYNFTSSKWVSRDCEDKFNFVCYN